MSIIDKLDLVNERREGLNKSLSDGADALLARYKNADTKSQKAFDRHHARLDAEDEAIAKTDAAIERLSNSAEDPAGNSSGSEQSSEPQKTNGTAHVTGTGTP